MKIIASVNKEVLVVTIVISETESFTASTAVFKGKGVVIVNEKDGKLTSDVAND